MRRQEIIIHDERQRIPFVRFLADLKLDKPIKITVEDYKKKRSLSQNALYWKWLNETAQLVADYSGHTSDEIHEFFKSKFLAPHVIEVNGEVCNHYTTTKLSTADMSAYMDRIHQFVTSELGIYLTLPEERMAR